MALDLLTNVSSFFLDKQYLVLLSSTLFLFIAVFIMWYFYAKQLPKKDLFNIPKLDSKSKFANFLNRFVYFIKYIVIFPIYSFMWFLIFSFLLVLMAKSRSIEEIMFFGIIIVSVTRIAAYVSPTLAEDIAKLLPWALILVFLTDPKAITIDSVLTSFNNFILALPNVAKYLLFIAFVEWILRMGHGIKEHFITKNKPKIAK